MLTATPANAWTRSDPSPTAVFDAKAPDPCPEVFFLGAMGSGQYRNRATHPMGRQVEELERRFASAIAKRDAPGSTRPIATAPVGIKYPAVDAIEAAIPGRATYDASVAKGRQAVVAQLQALATRCGPDARFVLAGFSQGAQVMHGALGSIPTSLRPQVSAVILLADPRYESHQAGVTYVGSNTSGGILGASPVATWAATRTTNVCAPSDGICQGAGGTLLPWPQHFNYLEFAGTWLTPPAQWAAGKTVVPDAMPTCNGAEATHVGSGAGETIVGTTGNDVIVGEGGNDHLIGRTGDDTICGGAGDDTIWGGNGTDTCAGFGGTDVVKNCP